MVWIHFLQIQWAEVAQHRCQKEKGSVGLGRAGELTELPGSAFIPVEHRKFKRPLQILALWL